MIGNSGLIRPLQIDCGLGAKAVTPIRRHPASPSDGVGVFREGSSDGRALILLPDAEVQERCGRPNVRR